MWSASILVTIATIGCRCRNDASLSSASGNQVPTMPQTRMNPRRFYQPAVNEGWVEPRFCVDAGNHRGGCRFAVRSCNGDAMTNALTQPAFRHDGLPEYALHELRQFPGYRQKSRWKQRPRWHHVRFPAMVEIVAPRFINCCVTGFGAKSEPLI